MLSRLFSRNYFLQTILNEARFLSNFHTPRPPIITIMGHVDHGKTTLLDTLRNSNLTEGEFGGITQKIGAFSVKTKDGVKMTFIDTPGHAAFSSMRARGTLITDLVVLVVAVDDGVMPQTLESIDYIKSAKVPFIVALNKVDMRNANVSGTKEDLFTYDVIIEDFGGEIPAVEISAKKNLNIDSLLAVISKQTKSLRHHSKGCAVVLESSILPIHGKVASVIITGDIMKVGDSVVSSSGARGRIRTMFDEYGHSIKSATVSTPVQISGFKNEIPQTGDQLMFGDKIKTGHQFIKPPKVLRKTAQSEVQMSVIIKCDTLGSCEAVERILSTYNSQKCGLKVIACEVGSVTMRDAENCSIFGGCIFAFNSFVESSAKEKIAELGVHVEEHKIIYHLVDALVKKIEEILPPTPVPTPLGVAEVSRVFMYGIRGKRVPVAGCRCFTGIIDRNARIRVLRPTEEGESVEVFDGLMTSLKKHRDDVSSVEKGDEFGLRAANDFIFMDGDKVECYNFVNHPTKLDWKTFE